MAAATATEWYVKSGEQVLGPFSPAELIQQACMGKILGDSELSASATGPWLKAEALESLELEWQVTPEGEPPLPCCHVMALRSWVESERVQPYWDILHLPSGEVYNVVDALCSALLAQNRILEERLSGQTAGPSGASAENRPQELRIQLDDARREASKWKRLYEDEIKRNESREQEMLQETESLRAWQRKAAERIKALERRQASLRETQSAGGEQTLLSGDRDLATAYQELKLQITHLLDSLDLKSRQLDEAREQVREMKLQIRQQQQQAEQKADRVSELHEDTLNQLNKMEQAHIQLTRSYRELNDRLIQLRNPKASPAPPERRAPPASEKVSPAAVADGKAPAKIKMT